MIYFDFGYCIIEQCGEKTWKYDKDGKHISFQDMTNFWHAEELLINEKKAKKRIVELRMS